MTEDQQRQLKALKRSLVSARGCLRRATVQRSIRFWQEESRMLLRAIREIEPEFEREAIAS